MSNPGGRAGLTRADYGFGFGLAVRPTPGVVRLLSSFGTFSWLGSTSTKRWVDSAHGLSVVFMANTLGPARWHCRYLIKVLVYHHSVIRARGLVSTEVQRLL